MCSATRSKAASRTFAEPHSCTPNPCSLVSAILSVGGCWVNSAPVLLALREDQVIPATRGRAIEQEELAEAPLLSCGGCLRRAVRLQNFAISDLPEA